MTEAPLLAQLRAWYAEELRFAGPVESEAVVRAFASVPRERVLGPGPWQSRSDANRGDGYRFTPDADPRHVYRDVLFALSASRRSTTTRRRCGPMCSTTWIWRRISALLHLGCGTGY